MKVFQPTNERVLITVVAENKHNLNNTSLFIDSLACLASTPHHTQVHNMAKRNFSELETNTKRKKNINCAVWQPEIRIKGSQKQPVSKEITVVNSVDVDNKQLQLMFKYLNKKCIHP